MSFKTNNNWLEFNAVIGWMVFFKVLFKQKIAQFVILFQSNEFASKSLIEIPKIVTKHIDYQISQQITNKLSVLRSFGKIMQKIKKIIGHSACHRFVKTTE